MERKKNDDGELKDKGQCKRPAANGFSKRASKQYSASIDSRKVVSLKHFGGSDANRPPSAATFAHWQPRYAEHGIPLFPVKFVDGAKKPAVKRYSKIGPKGSAQLVLQFADEQAFGFMCGPASNLTIGDVDAPGEVALYAALEMWGDTPAIIRTASGKHHLYYRHNGEGRHVRFLGRDKPFDILGGGFAVALPLTRPDWTI